MSQVLWNIGTHLVFEGVDRSRELAIITYGRGCDLIFFRKAFMC